MQQFIPFEDDWDALENLCPESLVPYHVGIPCRHDLAEETGSSSANSHAIVIPVRPAPLVGDSST
ncbi:hypothetical protein [Dyella sedimenti]|uniref:hypothetical protein n=1 Tax=Dyella sedimenti TaxID=2919947 RepID=UPI001FAAF0E7|nr:hypothetical protein [Dyella sedimenti]